MSLSAGAISRGFSALNERLCLQSNTPFPAFRTASYSASHRLHLSPGCWIINRARVNRIGTFDLSRGTERVRNGEHFHWSRPNERYLALSRPVCSVEPPHARGFRAFLRKISEIGDSLAERDGFEPSYMDPAPVASRSID